MQSRNICLYFLVLACLLTFSASAISPEDLADKLESPSSDARVSKSPSPPKLERTHKFYELPEVDNFEEQIGEASAGPFQRFWSKINRYVAM